MSWVCLGRKDIIGLERDSNYSSMAQRKRAGLITPRSLDRNELLLISFSAFLAWRHSNLKWYSGNNWLSTDHQKQSVTSMQVPSRNKNTETKYIIQSQIPCRRPLPTTDSDLGPSHYSSRLYSNTQRYIWSSQPNFDLVSTCTNHLSNLLKMKGNVFGAIPQRTFVWVPFLVAHKDPRRTSVPSLFPMLDEP